MNALPTGCVYQSESARCVSIELDPALCCKEKNKVHRETITMAVLMKRESFVALVIKNTDMSVLLGIISSA